MPSFHRRRKNAIVLFAHTQVRVDAVWSLERHRLKVAARFSSAQSTKAYSTFSLPSRLVKARCENHWRTQMRGLYQEKHKMCDCGQDTLSKVDPSFSAHLD